MTGELFGRVVRELIASDPQHASTAEIAAYTGGLEMALGLAEHPEGEALKEEFARLRAQAGADYYSEGIDALRAAIRGDRT